MRMSARGWAGALVALLLCGALLSLCVRIVPADAPAPPAPAKVAAGTEEPARTVGNGVLLIPVEGVPPGALNDSFTQARANGGHPHDAIDIMAARGRGVIAATNGRIEKLFWSHDGGRTIYERSPDGRRLYYYAHLDSYAPGLKEGAWVTRGTRIATVGSTGNADPAAPHLHFAVHDVRPDEPWYGGRAINPFPLLASAR